MERLHADTPRPSERCQRFYSTTDRAPYILCDECSSSASEVVRLGEGPGDGSRTAYVCRACLIRACEMMERD